MGGAGVGIKTFDHEKHDRAVKGTKNQLYELRNTYHVFTYLVSEAFKFSRQKIKTKEA